MIVPIGQAPASHTHGYLQEIWHALRGDPAHLARLTVTAKGALPSVFCVTDLATATIAAASLAIAELASLRTVPPGAAISIRD